MLQIISTAEAQGPETPRASAVRTHRYPWGILKGMNRTKPVPRMGTICNFKFTRVYPESKKVVAGSRGRTCLSLLYTCFPIPPAFCSTWAQCSSMVSGRTDWFRSTFAKLKPIDQGRVPATIELCIEPASDRAHVWRQCWPAVYLSGWHLAFYMRPAIELISSNSRSSIVVLVCYVSVNFCWITK